MNYYCKQLSDWNDIITRIECIYPGPEPIYLSLGLDGLLKFSLTRINELGEMVFEQYNTPYYYLKIFRDSCKKRRSNNQLIYRAFTNSDYTPMAKITQDISLKLNENEAVVLEHLAVYGIPYIKQGDYYIIKPDTVNQLIKVNSLITKYMES